MFSPSHLLLPSNGGAGVEYVGCGKGSGGRGGGWGVLVSWGRCGGGKYEVGEGEEGWF